MYIKIFREPESNAGGQGALYSYPGRLRGGSAANKVFRDLREVTLETAPADRAWTIRKAGSAAYKISLIDRDVRSHNGNRSDQGCSGKVLLSRTGSRSCAGRSFSLSQLHSRNGILSFDFVIGE